MSFLLGIKKVSQNFSMGWFSLGRKVVRCVGNESVKYCFLLGFWSLFVNFGIVHLQMFTMASYLHFADRCPSFWTTFIRDLPPMYILLGCKSHIILKRYDAHKGAPNRPNLNCGQSWILYVRWTISMSFILIQIKNKISSLGTPAHMGKKSHCHSSLCL